MLKILHSKGRYPSRIKPVVINTCYGEFGLSKLAESKYRKLTGLTSPRERDCPFLVSLVRELGKEANGPYADLKVVEIPAHIRWEIFNSNGVEEIREAPKSWR